MDFIENQVPRKSDLKGDLFKLLREKKKKENRQVREFSPV